MATIEEAWTWDEGRLSVRDVVSQLYKAKPSDVIDLRFEDMSGFDLGGVDFKQADLSETNLFGANLARANLNGVKLANTNLNRVVITNASFDNADLSGASLMRPTVFSDLTLSRSEAPSFRRATLTGMRVTGNIDGANFVDAVMNSIHFGPHEPRGDISSFPYNFCRGCDFSRVSAQNANFHLSSLVLAKFCNADLRGADFSRADLSGADLSGADLRGADFTDAVLEGTNFQGAQVRDAIGLTSLPGG